MTREIIKAIGLMSGTSLDGIDAAIITTDGDKIFEFGEFITVPYEESLRERLRAAVDTKEVQDDSLERDMTYAHVAAVKKVLAMDSISYNRQRSESEDEPALSVAQQQPMQKSGDFCGADIKIIGFHGQTIIHRPDLGWSLQIGDGQLLANETGIEVANDFRNPDMRMGGQGAPLVPVFHRALTEELPRPIAIVNVGGVANVTWIRGNGEMLAFDTGPGNAMINDIMKKYFDKDFDDGGKIAASGIVDEEVLSSYVDDEYFKIKPPKSLDRNHFSLDKVAHLKPEDAVATLTAFTAISIMMSNSYFDNPVDKFYITGGGRHNKRLMETLGNKAEPIEAIGHNGDAFEAQAFAYLAVRAKYGLPITFASTTGCKELVTENLASFYQPSL
ncbi:MAG: anhydro-N-acetylmuramic acid kinase [Alphaproteobacteria bacterium CG11_big_fil_rev_8_21_14_0_20_44_7]|nr:MAG: anhydro-N-acetylmuramic acid kinase [Alphaproteobacteria bacterium CG11_big_fil_rev_8_21_14_0_20_44_7]